MQGDASERKESFKDPAPIYVVKSSEIELSDVVGRKRAASLSANVRRNRSVSETIGNGRYIMKFCEM